MKKRLTIAAFAFIAFICAAAPAAYAQSASQHTADIPFAFQVGDQLMPAGKYLITVGDSRIQLKALQGHDAIVALTVGKQTHRTTEVSHLTFDERAGAKVLTDVYFGGSNDAVELLANKVRTASRM